jgi:DNA-binding Lrp family transcriptional regulator
MAKKIDEDVKRQILELHQRGYPNNRIAKQLGLSRNTVANILKELEKPEDKIDLNSILKGLETIKSDSEKIDYLLDNITNLYQTDEYFRNKMQRKFFYYMKQKEYLFLKRMEKLSQEYVIGLDEIASYIKVIIKLKVNNFKPSQILPCCEKNLSLKKLDGEIKELAVKKRELESENNKILNDIKNAKKTFEDWISKRDDVQNYQDLKDKYKNLEEEYKKLIDEKNSLNEKIAKLEENKKGLEEKIQNMNKITEEISNEFKSKADEMIHEYEEKQKSILEEHTRDVKLLLEYVIAKYLTDQNDLVLINALVDRFNLDGQNIIRIKALLNNIIETDFKKLLLEILKEKIDKQ